MRQRPSQFELAAVLSSCYISVVSWPENSVWALGYSASQGRPEKRLDLGSDEDAEHCQPAETHQSGRARQAELTRKRSGLYEKGFTQTRMLK